MMDTEFIKYLSTLGVGGLIAGLMFLVYRKDMRMYSDQWKGQSECLLQVVKENTSAVVSNTATIQALHQREDKIQSYLENVVGLSYPRHSRKDEH